MSPYFTHVALSSFWHNSDYARKSYVEEQPTAALIKEIKKLGDKLPDSYLEFRRHQNGGIPRNTCFPILTNDSWADHYVALMGSTNPAKADMSQ